MIQGQIKIHQRTYGTGPDRALFLHCSLAHSGAWRGVATALSDRLTMTAFDMPNHGKSANWDGQSDIHDLVTHAAAQFLDGPMHLIGHSFGATVALRLAQKYPDLVRSLTLIEPVLFAVAKSRQRDIYDAYVQQSKPFSAALAAGNLPLAAKLFTAVWGGGIPWEALGPEQQADFARQMPLIAASDSALFADTVGMIAPGQLEQMMMPVLLIRGANSPVIITAIHDALFARLPQARLAVVEGAGHMVPITHALKVAGLIRAHVDT